MSNIFFKKITFLAGFSLLLFFAPGAQASLPVLDSISPTSISEDSAVTINATGSGFINGVSQIKFNGTIIPSTFVSDTRISAPLTPLDTAVPGTYPVKVNNSGAGGGDSAVTINFIVTSSNNPVPNLTSIVPTSTMAGSPDFNLVLNGTGFVPNSQVKWNGANRTTTFNSTTQLSASIPAADLVTAGSKAVKVSNPTPGGGDSNVKTFTVNNLVPTLTSISPASATQGTYSSVSVNMYGTNFVSNSVPYFNGHSINLQQFVSPTHLITSIGYLDLLTAGTFPMDVFNPTPGGGHSNTKPFVVVGNGGTLEIIKNAVGGDETFFYNVLPTPGVFSIATLNGNGSSGNLPLSTGSYSVQENLPPGWVLDSATCSNGTPASFNIVAGYKTTCTFRNIKLGSITVNKVALNNNANTQFNFHASSLLGYSRDFTINAINGTGIYSLLNLPIGTYYTVSEPGPLPSNWAKTGDTCASIYLAAGQDATCTITNTYTPPAATTLKIDKIVVPSSDSGKFNLQIDGVNAGTGTAVGNGGTTGAVSVTAGNHTVGETPAQSGSLDDYIISIWGDCASDGSINLSSGQNKVCTITNTKKPKLTVVKTISPTSDTGKFNLFINGTKYATDIGNGQGTGIQTGIIGSNTFAETAGTGTSLSNYTSVVSGDGCGSGTTSGTINLAAGDSKTCYITNTSTYTPPAPGNITIIKYSLGGDGTFTFNSNFGVSSLTTVGGNKSQTVSGLSSTATYNISENNQSGWTLQSASCNNGSPINAITIAPGGTTICTFTNAKQGSFRIFKSALPSGHPAAQFDYIISSSTYYSTKSIPTQSAGGSVGPFSVDPGTAYSITENGIPSGWKFDSVTCDKAYTPGPAGSNKAINITVNPGQLTTCTFTNSYVPPTTTATITLVKKTTGGSGIFKFDFKDSFAATKSSHTLNPNSANFFQDQTIISKIAPGSSYSIFENLPSAPPGWSLTSASCSGGKGTFNAAYKSIESINLVAGDNITCTFNNTFTGPNTGSIKLVKNTPGTTTSAQFYFDVTGPTTLSPKPNITTSDGTGSTGLLSVAAGNYVIIESIPNGWKFDDVSCDKSSTKVSYGVKDVVVLAGQTTTCTFTNEERGALKIVKKTTGGDGTFHFDLLPYTATITTLNGEGDTGVIPMDAVDTLSITEDVPDGWSFDSVTCDKAYMPGAPTFPNSAVNITISPGQTTTCTFTDILTVSNAKLTVKKVLIPSSDAGRFNLQIDGITYASNVGDEGTTGKITVSAESHQVGESVVDATNPDDYDYAFGGDCSSTGSITLNDGDDKTCTIINTKKSTPPPPDPTPDPDPDPTPEEEDDFNVNFVLPPEGKGGGGSIIPP